MKIAIFHGWGANSKDNWFPWLKDELEKLGHEVFCPDFPGSQKPKLNEWIKKALEFEIDEKTILVGHSLGTILIQRILEQKKIRSAYLVSAFDYCLDIEELKNFFEEDFDYEQIKQSAKNIIILNSDNDHYISVDIAKRLQKKLDCGMIVFEGMNHLSNGTGNLMFPELLEMIKNENLK